MSRHRRGTGTIFTAGSDTLWIRYYVNGRPITENAQTKNGDVASELLQKRIYEAKQGLVPEPSVIRKLTVTNLYEALEREYQINGRKSLDDLKARWKLHLEPFFGFMRPANVSTDMVNRYIDQRQQEGAENATINRELSLLKRAFHLGRECTPPKVQNVPYFRMLRENNTRKGFLETADYERLARECAKYGLWMRTLLELAHTYGWRHAELLSLRVGQVSIADRTIRLNPGETKNDDGREVTLTPLVRQLLQECIRGKQSDDFVLTRKDGRPVGDFRGSWETATKNAGVAGLLFHDLRRTAVRNMVRAGIPEAVAMQISGHKTRSVFERYNVVSQADISEAVTKLVRQRTVRVEPEIQEAEACSQVATVRPN
jgi:integrase